LTGARPPADSVAPNRPRVTWLGGPAQLAAALPVIEPDPTTTVAVMEDRPVAEELKEKLATPELSLVRLPDVAPGPVTGEGRAGAPWTGLPCPFEHGGCHVGGLPGLRGRRGPGSWLMEEAMPCHVTVVLAVPAPALAWITSVPDLGSGVARGAGRSGEEKHRRTTQLWIELPAFPRKRS